MQSRRSIADPTAGTRPKAGQKGDPEIGQWVNLCPALQAIRLAVPLVDYEDSDEYKTRQQESKEWEAAYLKSVRGEPMYDGGKDKGGKGNDKGKDKAKDKAKGASSSSSSSPQ